MSKKIVNLTPYIIRVIIGDGTETLAIEPCGTICRVKEETKTVSSIDGIPVRVSRPTSVEGLPPQKEDVIYITSGMAAAAAWALGRADVYCPSTLADDVIRDEKGLTIAIKALKGKP